MERFDTKDFYGYKDVKSFEGEEIFNEKKLEEYLGDVVNEGEEICIRDGGEFLDKGLELRAYNKKVDMRIVPLTGESLNSFYRDRIREIKRSNDPDRNMFLHFYMSRLLKLRLRDKKVLGADDLFVTSTTEALKSLAIDEKGMHMLASGTSISDPRGYYYKKSKLNVLSSFQDDENIYCDFNLNLPDADCPENLAGCCVINKKERIVDTLFEEGEKRTSLQAIAQGLLYEFMKKNDEETTVYKGGTGESAAGYEESEDHVKAPVVIKFGGEIKRKSIGYVRQAVSVKSLREEGAESAIIQAKRDDLRGEMREKITVLIENLQSKVGPSGKSDYQKIREELGGISVLVVPVRKNDEEDMDKYPYTNNGRIEGFGLSEIDQMIDHLIEQESDLGHLTIMGCYLPRKERGLDKGSPKKPHRRRLSVSVRQNDTGEMVPASTLVNVAEEVRGIYRKVQSGVNVSVEEREYFMRQCEIIGMDGAELLGDYLEVSNKVYYPSGAYEEGSGPADIEGNYIIG